MLQERRNHILQKVTENGKVCCFCHPRHSFCVCSCARRTRPDGGCPPSAQRGRNACPRGKAPRISSRFRRVPYRHRSPSRYGSSDRQPSFLTLLSHTGGQNRVISGTRLFRQSAGLPPAQNSFRSRSFSGYRRGKYSGGRTSTSRLRRYLQKARTAGYRTGRQPFRQSYSPYPAAAWCG